MKDLVSQDYIDYQDGRDHFRYFGQPVDPLGKDSQKISLLVIHLLYHTV